MFVSVRQKGNRSALTASTTETIIALASVVAAFGAILLVIASAFAIRRGLPDRRQHSLEQRRLDAFHEVLRYSWGLTEQDHHRYCKENMRAVRALNVARVAFLNTPASKYLEKYRRQKTARSAVNAIVMMADTCNVDMPKTYDVESVFGPSSKICECHSVRVSNLVVGQNEDN